MRPSNKSRSRNKSGNSGHNQRRNVGNVINRVFDSAGPDGKVRGTPQQIIDKYMVLARDAQLSGDRVAGENYLQHAEHYSRLLGEAQRQQQEARAAQEQQREEQRAQREAPRNDDTPKPAPAVQDNVQPAGSGLTMIDPMDTDNPSGPVETPESRSSQVQQAAMSSAPQPAPRTEAPQGGGEAAPVEAKPKPSRKPVASKSPDAVDGPAANGAAAPEAAGEGAQAAPEKKPARKPRAPRKPRATKPAETSETPSAPAAD